ncbi:MAG: MazG family protein [Ornithinimicrobium sp.]
MDHPRRLSLLVTSPRVAPGLLSHQAWHALTAADRVWARGSDGQSSAHHPLLDVVTDAGVNVQLIDEPEVAVLARLLLGEAESGTVIWIGSADADPGLSDTLAQGLTAMEDPPELEMLIGSWDVPGSRLLDAVTVMDRLRSPSGCPWDAAQTHNSLTPFLVEETYELLEALEVGDRDNIVEELGDVLLQVLFHARVAEEADDVSSEDTEEAFDIDDVAASLVDKLVRRHPHVFAGGTASTPGEVESSWQELKAAEKPEREHLLDGIPAGMPELARASKIAGRLIRAGQAEWLQDVVGHTATTGVDGEQAAQLLATAIEAHRLSVDPSAALRAALRSIESQARGLPPPE